MPSADRIGFIGLGNMGAPMAARLAAAGYRLWVNDRDRARAEGFAAEHGATVVTDLAALGRAVDIAITILPDGAAVNAVVAGPGGLAEGLATGSLVADMSSSSPVGTVALGARLAERGIGLVDAPVSGGVRRAVDGSLAIMAGGVETQVARAWPLFAAMGKQLFRTGPLGSGHAMKALNNYVSAAGLVAAAEAVMVGERFGLAPETMIDILNASSGRNNSTENKFKQFILQRRFASGFGLGLMAKDLKTAAAIAREAGIPLPLGETCVALWADAEAALGGQADHTEIVRHLEALRAQREETR